MSPRNTTSVRAGMSAARSTTRGRTASADAQARRGIVLQTVREGTPLQLRQLFASLEASGDIGPDEESVQDDVAVDEDLLEMDAEMDLADEDAVVGEEWADDWAAAGDGDAECEPSVGLFSAPRFEIVVYDGVCRVPVDEWCVRSARTPLGQQVLYEMDSRLWTLRRIAAWLTERRGGFLRERNLWQLGCEALEDVRQGRIPVQQKSFMQCAGLAPKVSEASLSRYIRATEISWKDGSAALDILFGDEARRMWVANAVCQFVVESGGSVTEMLDSYASVPVLRSADRRRRLAQMSPDAMDLPTFIEKANMHAGTRWQDVVTRCRMSMLGRRT